MINFVQCRTMFPTYATTWMDKRRRLKYSIKTPYNHLSGVSIRPSDVSDKRHNVLGQEEETN